MKKMRTWKGYYTLEDMECSYCLHYQGKRKPCPLNVCCCAEEKREARKREQAKESFPLQAQA